MQEIWKEIEGSDGLFSVSSEGRIRQNHYEYISLQGRKIIKEEKIIEPGTWQSRYLRVDIQNCRKDKPFRKAVYIHKLVAEYFLGPRPEGYEIDHIDGNYLNNKASNLRYVTPKENMNNEITKQKQRESANNNYKDPIKGKILRAKISEATKRGMNTIECKQKLKNRPIHEPGCKNKICVNKNNINKYIKQEELEYYLKLGYKQGQFKKDSTKNKIRIYKGNERTYINKDQLQEYIFNGWIVGRGY